jgi:hypothetical protein
MSWHTVEKVSFKNKDVICIQGKMTGMRVGNLELIWDYCGIQAVKIEMK